MSTDEVKTHLQIMHTWASFAHDNGMLLGMPEICSIEKWTEDALKLIAESEPRVLTLDEALGADDPVYFESCGSMECWVDGYISDDLQCAVFYRFTASEFMLPLARYRKDWRCWSARPTEKQKKEAKWG